MSEFTQIPSRVVVVSFAIAAVTLAFDLATPLGVAGGLPYVAMVLCGHWTGSRNFTILLASAASLLTGAGYLLSSAGGVPWIVLTNRGLAISVIWVTALVIVNRIMESERRGENERNLAAAQRISRLGSWDWDIVTGSLAWSDEVYRIFGLKPQQFGATYEAFLEYIHPDDREALETAVQLSLETGGQYEIEHRVIRDDGSLRYVVERGEVYLDAAGKARAMRGTVHDVTEKQLKDEEIRRLALVIKQLKDAVLILQIDGTIIDGNESVETVFGYSREDLIGQSSFMLHADPDAWLAGREDVMQAISSEGNWTGLVELKQKNGAIRQAELSLTSLLDDNGNHIGNVSITRDVTDEKLAQEEIKTLNKELEKRVERRTAELRDQMEFSERLIDTAHAIILVLDTEGHIKKFNRYLEDLAGFPLSDVVGKSWFDTFVPEDQQASIDAPHGDAVARKEIHGVQNAIRTKSGEILQIEWFNTTLRDSKGKAWGTLSVGHDITERLKLNAQVIQSSKLATLGEMATGIAHELNQPLGIIGLAAENLSQKLTKKETDPDYAAKKIDRILSQVKRATKIIDHMRIFGRQPDVSPKPVQLAAALEGVMTLVGQQLNLAGIVINSDLPDDLPAVTGHHVQVEQVLLNLINNARDAILANSGSREKEITITGKFDPDKAIIILTVSDTGGGIDPKYLERVFEPFFTTKDINKGTGLGLSISYGIVSEMGGRLLVENIEDGAMFTLELPFLDNISDTGIGDDTRPGVKDRAEAPT
ncbi:MAG: PAS domain S-box protein [Proteobacteria bacterium]|nr:PAS domain S-box protein [Pseudomonadota bacterium]